MVIQNRGMATDPLLRNTCIDDDRFYRGNLYAEQPFNIQISSTTATSQVRRWTLSLLKLDITAQESSTLFAELLCLFED